MTTVAEPIGLSALIQYPTRMILLNPRAGMVVGTLAVPSRKFGQSIQPLGLPGSVPVCPPSIPSISNIDGQTKTLPSFDCFPPTYPSRSRIGAQPSSGTVAPPVTPVIVYDGMT